MQLDQFVQQINAVRGCNTPGCNGILCPTSLKSKGLGGAVSVFYVCNGCALKSVHFESSPKYEVFDTTEIGVSVQVAFIIAGCTHSTYYQVLQQGLGMDAMQPSTFMSTIKRMHPVVKAMVDEMCEEVKADMKSLDPKELGSWSRAVTSADGAWMTRGFHSKNATFNIRNYCNGVLLYYKHLCQRGRDEIIDEPLYEGTYKDLLLGRPSRERKRKVCK